MEKYTEKSLLGEGGFGVVFGGIVNATGERVVIKKCKPSNDNEIKMLQKSSNVNGVVRLLDFFIVDDQQLLIMSTIDDCEDLYNYIEIDTVLPIQDAIIIYKQVVDIVVDLFYEGIFHRDIKEENILVQRHSLQVMLIDLGGATDVHDGYYKETQGTQTYLPPEVFQNEQYKAEPYTTWQLGFLLYSLIEGQEPFKEYDHEKDDLMFTKNWDKDMQLLVMGMLDVDENQRLTLDIVKACVNDW